MSDSIVIGRILAQLLLLAWPLVLQSDFGRLEVSIRDAGTREGVPGVPVTLTASTGNEVRSPTTTILTDPRGVAVFASLPAGTYFIKIDGAGYKPLSFTEYVLIEAGSQRRAEIPINQTATVTGRVLNSLGEPMSDSVVSLLSSVYVYGREGVRPVPGGRQITGRDGTFRMPEVAFGDYYIQVDNSPLLQSALGLDPPRFVYYPASTDLATAGRVAVRNPDVSIGDIRVPDTRVFKISGTIVNPFGTASAAFYLAPVNANMPIEATLSMARFKSSPDSKELSFEIGGLVPGGYVLYHLSRSGTEDSATRMVVDVGDRNVEDVRIVARKSTEVRGRVISATGPLPKDLHVVMQAKEPLPALLFVGSSFGPHPVEDSGAFAVGGLVEGVRYGVSLSRLPSDGYIEDIRLSNLSMLNEGSFIARSSEESLEIKIARPGGSFHGVVRDAASQVVAKATVILVPMGIRHATSAFYRRVTSDANGEFTLSGIAPGDYQFFAFALAPPLGAEESAAFMAPYTGRGVVVQASGGALSETSLRVIP